MIVLDANILIRAVLGRRVRQLIESYSAKRVRFVAPDVAFEDAQRYLPLLLKKRGKSTGGVSEALEYLRSIIQPIYREPMVNSRRKRDSGFEGVMRMIGQY
jgi:predicted nucleic acid-binding protein